MDAATRQAVLAAAWRQSEGHPVGLSDAAFWRIHDVADIAERRDILNRANAITEAAYEAVTTDWQGTLESAFAITDPAYGGNPLDSASAKVWAKVEFQDRRGAVVYRTFAEQFSWDTNLQDILQAIDDWIEEMETEYETQGLSGGTLLSESVLIA